jgi:hypothetical protein
LAELCCGGAGYKMRSAFVLCHGLLLLCLIFVILVHAAAVDVVVVVVVVVEVTLLLLLPPLAMLPAAVARNRMHAARAWTAWCY